MTRNAAAQLRADADLNTFADAAAESEALAEALATWPVPGTENHRPDTPLTRADADREAAAWRAAEAEKTPAWRSVIVRDLLYVRRSGRWRDAMEQRGLIFDSRANAEALREHLGKLALPPDADGYELSLLALVVEGKATPANTRRRDPILPRITLEPPHLARQRGELILAPEGQAGLQVARMPLFPDALHDDLQVPLLDLADVVTGERAVIGGRAAAHELRLVFEGVTGIGEAARRGKAEPISWTVAELLEAFYRYGGRMNRTDRPGDWALIRRACLWVNGSAIPWRVPSGNVQPWALMRLHTLPNEQPALSDPVVFNVLLPPGSGPGPVVNRPELREAGRISSPAFRIGVAVPSITWIPGRTRLPVPGAGGLWIGDASRYPVFSTRDRRRIAFGHDAVDDTRGRPQPRVDAAWRKAANEAGVVILDTEAVDRDGKRGWIVVPMAAAEAITKPDTQRKRT